MVRSIIMKIINKKSLVIFTLLFLIFVGIGFLVLSRRKAIPTPTKQEVPLQQKIPQPSIPGSLKGGITVKFTFTSEEFKFPKTLPLIEVPPRKITKDEARKIAKNLGFSKEPLEARDVREGIKYYWTDPEKSLVVTPNSGIVSYALNLSEPPKVANKQLSDKELARIAKEMVAKLGVNAENVELSDIVPLKENPLTEGFSNSSREGAQIFQINLRYKVSEYQILTITPDHPLIFVQILPDGTVYNSRVVMLGGATRSQGEFPLKNYEEIKTSTNEMILVAILNAYVSISELNKGDIRNATIDKISLYYLLDNPSSKVIQPVYLLEGPVEIPGYKNTRAQFYLPAIKN